MHWSFINMDNVLEILNSNTYYNILENGNPLRAMEEAKNEFLNPQKILDVIGF